MTSPGFSLPRFSFPFSPLPLRLSRLGLLPVAIDMSAAKAPPARKAATPRKAPEPTPAPVAPEKSLKDQRVDGLIGLAQLGQGICLMAGLHADAMTIGKFFPPIATELANIADDNETVAGPIDFIIKVGPYGALIAAGMPFVLQILANHKVIDATKAMGQGIVPPEVLEAQMKAEILRMQAEAMRQQQQALNDANAAAEAYAKMMAPPPDEPSTP